MASRAPKPGHALTSKVTTESAPGTPTAAQDPVFAVWARWKEAHTRLESSCNRQQSLEAEIIKAIGFQDQSAGEAECGKYKTRWDEVAEQSGYSAALQSEAAASEEECALASKLFATNATSLAGVLAKLEALITREAPSATSSEPPWPELRGIRTDVFALVKIQRCANPAT